MNRQLPIYDISSQEHGPFGVPTLKLEFGIYQSFRIIVDRTRLEISSECIIRHTNTVPNLVCQFFTHLSKFIDLSLITRPY